MINAYREHRYPEVNGELFRDFGFDNLYAIVDAILDQAGDMGLDERLEEAKVALKEVQLISSLRAESAFLSEGSSAYIFIDYESHSLFREFCNESVSVASTLDRMACEAYFDGEYVLALRLRLAHHFEWFHRNKEVINNSQRLVTIPQLGEQFLMSSSVSHELGHVFFHCKSLSGKLDKATDLVAKYIEMAQKRTVQFAEDFVVMSSLPEKICEKILDYDCSNIDNVLIEELYSDAHGAVIKERTFHWGDEAEVHDGETLLGAVLIAAFSSWQSCIRYGLSSNSITSIKDIVQQGKLRYSTIIRATCVDEKFIAVGPQLAKHIWDFIDILIKNGSGEDEDEFFYLDLLSTMRKHTSSSNEHIEYVPTWMFLIYCDEVYDEYTEQAIEVINYCSQLILTDCFNQELAAISDEEEAMVSFCYLSGMESHVNSQVLARVESRLPVSKAIPLPTWTPLMCQICGVNYNEEDFES